MHKLVPAELKRPQVFGSKRCDCREQLDLSLRYVQENGGGAVIYLAQEGRGIGLANKVAAYALQVCRGMYSRVLEGCGTNDVLPCLSFGHVRSCICTHVAFKGCSTEHIERAN